MTDWLRKECTECGAPLPCTEHGRSLHLAEMRMADGTAHRIPWEWCGPDRVTVPIRKVGEVTGLLTEVEPRVFAYVEES